MGDQKDPREVREMLRAMQAGELTVSRGVELLDMWLAGNYSDDLLPPVRQDLIEEDSMSVVIIDRLRAENERLTAELAAGRFATDFAEAYWEEYRLRNAEYTLRNLDLRDENRELMRELTALRTQPAAVPAWQPIETAPKDGTFLLVWNMHGINEVFWNDDADGWHHDVEFDNTFPLRGDHPTHWMPLPAAPETTK